MASRDKDREKDRDREKEIEWDAVDRDKGEKEREKERERESGFNSFSSNNTYSLDEPTGMDIGMGLDGRQSMSM